MIRALMFIIVFSPVFATAAPVITSVSSGVVVGSGFVSVPTYDKYDYMDDFTSEFIRNTAGSNFSAGTSGNISWLGSIQAEDAEAILAEGIDVFRISKNNSFYSTGYSWSQGLARLDRAYGVMQHEFKITGISYTTGAWSRFYVRVGDSSLAAPLPYDPNTHKLGFWWYNLSGGYGNRSLVVGNVVNRHPEFTVTNQSDGALWSYDDTDDNIPAMNCFPGTNKIFEVKVWQKLNTFTDGVSDGNAEAQLYINGVKVFDLADHVAFGARHLTNELNAIIDQIEVGGNISGGSDEWFEPGQKCYRYFDDFAVDGTDEPKSIPCVYLSNSATWGSGVTDRWNGDATFKRQVVGGLSTLGLNTWSDTGFTYQQDTTGLETGQSVYLYVTNWDGETNTDGFLVSSPPIVEILTASGQVTTASVFEITGTATADTGLTIAGVTCPLQAVTPDDGTWDELSESWTCQATLSAGVNNLTFTGTDSVANTGTDSIDVTRTSIKAAIRGSAIIKNATIH